MSWLNNLVSYYKDKFVHRHKVMMPCYPLWNM